MHPQRSRQTISGIVLADIDDIDRCRTRFWSKVDRGTGPDDCWLWTAGTSKRTGYGFFTVKYRGRQRKMDAHRLSYLLTHESIGAGLYICHHCDIAYSLGDKTYCRCVNPHHLWAGTPRDNMRDAMNKNRLPQAHFWDDPSRQCLTHRRAHGEQAGHAKLTDGEVQEIRTLYASGVTQVLLAQTYGVNQPHISRIVRRANWKHL